MVRVVEAAILINEGSICVNIQNNIDLRIVTNDMINEEYIASLV